MSKMQALRCMMQMMEHVLALPTTSWESFMPIENVHCRIGYPVEHSLCFPESLVRIPDRVELQDRVNLFLTILAVRIVADWKCTLLHRLPWGLNSEKRTVQSFSELLVQFMTGLVEQGYSLDLFRKQNQCIWDLRLFSGRSRHKFCSYATILFGKDLKPASILPILKLTQQHL